MPAAKSFFLLMAACICCATVAAQVVMPAYTGYALPVEPNDEDSSSLFNEKAGAQHWTDTRQQLQYFFNSTAAGQLHIVLSIKNSSPGSRLRITVAGHDFRVAVPVTKSFKNVTVGTVNLPGPGFYPIVIAALSKGGKTIAAIQSIQFSGTAAAGLQFNTKPRRNAASVHLMYSLPDTARAVSFYSELSVPPGADQLYTYYMACGFARGYFGIQVNSATERRVIFSLWDAGNEATDRKKVAEENKVALMGKGAGVVAEGFGNEGTGGHSHLVYNWKAGETYKFLVTALPDSATRTTTYAGYFFMPDLQQWKFIAAFRAPADAQYMHHLYSFVENFNGVNGQLPRKAFFGNQWIRNENGQWTELTNASFSCDATGRAGDRTDMGGGVAGNQFYLWNGGFEPANARLGDVFTRAPTAQTPAVDFNKNADSAVQAAADRQAILAALSPADSAVHSKDGIYYEILKEGTGSYVHVTDTVVAYYKGALLNGEVFDQTKEKPATFPLNRLIKGWQVGLPLCRVGGKIRLIIPSGLAYSIRVRSPKIPPNSVLVFDIEVVEARKKLSPLK